MNWPWVARARVELLEYRLQQLENSEGKRAAEAEALVAELTRVLARQRMQEARKLKGSPQNGAQLDAALLQRKGYS